jgi:hypothetical protein
MDHPHFVTALMKPSDAFGSLLCHLFRWHAGAQRLIQKEAGQSDRRQVVDGHVSENQLASLEMAQQK